MPVINATALPTGNLKGENPFSDDLADHRPLRAPVTAQSVTRIPTTRPGS